MGARHGKHKLGARAGKHKLGARAGKYKSGTRAGKYKLRTRAMGGGQAKEPGAGKYKYTLNPWENMPLNIKT